VGRHQMFHGECSRATSTGKGSPAGTKRSGQVSSTPGSRPSFGTAANSSFVPIPVQCAAASSVIWLLRGHRLQSQTKLRLLHRHAARRVVRGGRAVGGATRALRLAYVAHSSLQRGHPGMPPLVVNRLRRRRVAETADSHRDGVRFALGLPKHGRFANGTEVKAHREAAVGLARVARNTQLPTRACRCSFRHDQ
jgi:hypothetical protein